MDLHTKLESMGLKLPSAPKPVATYVPYARTGNLVFISGQLPLRDGQLIATGRVPTDLTIEEAAAGARQCALNAIAVLGDAIGGDWSRFVRIVRVGAFVACEDDFTAQPQVANGASELLGALFGEAGRHARAAVGVNTLPLGAAVEVELLAEVRG